MTALLELEPRLVEAELIEPETEFAEGYVTQGNPDRCPVSIPKITIACWG